MEFLFSILLDGSHDVSIKEQATIALCYMDSKEHAIEHFLGLAHISNMTILSLKAAIEAMLSKHNLSISRIRGQANDRVGNMQGEFNGLKTLTMQVNASCFIITF